VYAPGRTDAGVQIAQLVDDTPPRQAHIAHQGEALAVQRDAFGGQHVLRAAITFALAEYQRTNAVGSRKPTMP
jgi:hypothetical protein